ncbi:MAG: PEP-CTERM sorting domain-containing protein, partial [Verrucomicrobiaceae bacterium]
PNSGGTLQSKDATAHTFANPVAFNGTSAVLGAAGTGDLTFTGDVTLGADLAVSINNSTTRFTNAIGDGGIGRGLTKAGPGTLILDGTNSYTGNTTVDAGSLIVNGSISGSNVLVNSGATLGGSGTVGSVDLLGGTVAPGNGPGTLSTNSFSLDSTAAIKFELAQAGVTGGGINDLISVAGNLTLDGTLQVTPLSGFGGGTYPLFTYTGTLTNSGLALDLAFLALYPGSAISTATQGIVNLVVVPEPTTGALLMISLGAFAGFRRNRKHSRSTH